ncbi:MAG: VOC family protein [Chloroflexi bacterium]|nr:VOC family protein [Chloroflexota bacterium]
MSASELAVVGELGVIALDHTAVAVRSIQAALPLYQDLLGGQPNGYERIDRRGFMWFTLRYPNGSQVELLEPVGEGGFLHAFLERYGERPHHMTFRVRDLRVAVERAKAAGLRVVDEDYGDPRWQEAFISPRSAFGTIIQLAQTSLSSEERHAHWSASLFNS